jgi:energy-coupling factor transporter ATP-binding protein EcfA2
VKVLCIGGFLGSGKTTLLLHVARFMVSQSLKVAIVENEIGCGVVEPGVFAGRADVAFGRAVGPAELRVMVVDVLAELGRLLADAGCTLVGHIKGSLDVGDGGGLRFNVTRLRGPASFRGDWTKEADSAVLTLNVIVFGLGGAAVAEAVGGCLSVWSAAQVRWRRKVLDGRRTPEAVRYTERR